MAAPLVYLATCLDLPEPDVDESLLVAALGAAGADAAVKAWDDLSVDWSEASLVVLRSTWNYFHRAEAFLHWIAHVAARTRIMNPAPVVSWNVNKVYLEALRTLGLAVVPTTLVRRGETRSLQAIADMLGIGDVVIKPAISAGSFSTRRFSMLEQDEGDRFLAELCRERDVLVQPFVRSVEGYGERAIVWIDGEITHAVRKNPRFMDDHELVSERLSVEPDEQAFAQSTLTTLSAFGLDLRSLLYARIDIARDELGRPMLMELELIEPSLFLAQNKDALARFAQGIVARAREPFDASR